MNKRDSLCSPLTLIGKSIHNKKKTVTAGRPKPVAKTWESQPRFFLNLCYRHINLNTIAKVVLKKTLSWK